MCPTRSGPSSRLTRALAPELSLSTWIEGTSASSSSSLLTAIRNIGPACGEAGAPTVVRIWVTRPAAGARRTDPDFAAGRGRQPGQFLIRATLSPSRTSTSVTCEPSKVGADHRFLARDNEAGHTNHVGKAGIGRAGDRHEGTSRWPGVVGGVRRAHDADGRRQYAKQAGGELTRASRSRSRIRKLPHRAILTLNAPRVSMRRQPIRRIRNRKTNGSKIIAVQVHDVSARRIQQTLSRCSDPLPWRWRCPGYPPRRRHCAAWQGLGRKARRSAWG